VTWGPVAGARSYQVWAIGSDRRRTLYVEPVSKRRLRIAPVFPEVSLRVTVSAVGGVRDQAGPARTLMLRRLR
jgi:hypothetical protein